LSGQAAKPHSNRVETTFSYRVLLMHRDFLPTVAEQREDSPWVKGVLGGCLRHIRFASFRD
jgi:hypothetical protein